MARQNKKLFILASLEAFSSFKKTLSIFDEWTEIQNIQKQMEYMEE